MTKQEKYQNLPIGTIMIASGLKGHSYTWRKITRDSWVLLKAVGDRWKPGDIYYDTPRDYIKSTDQILNLKSYLKEALCIGD